MSAVSTVAQAGSLFANLVRLLFLGVLSVGGYFGWRTWNAHDDATRALAAKDLELARVQDELAARGEELRRERAENGRLTAEVAAKTRQIERLELAQKLLKVEQRKARIIVLDQTPAETAGRVRTRFRFIELDAQGQPLGDGQEVTLEGDLLYVDSWVVKFEDLFVEQNDPLRAASLCLFRRLFGEFQQPSEGTVIDVTGGRPDAYGGSREMTGLEKELWSDFWSYANDPRRAEALGVRAAHGEAPSMKLKPGEVYVITLRASGGLTMQPERPATGSN